MKKAAMRASRKVVRETGTPVADEVGDKPPPEIDMSTIRSIPENDDFEGEGDPRAEFLEHLR